MCGGRDEQKGTNLKQNGIVNNTITQTRTRVHPFDTDPCRWGACSVCSRLNSESTAASWTTTAAAGGSAALSLEAYSAFSL